MSSIRFNITGRRGHGKHDLQIDIIIFEVSSLVARKYLGM